MNLSNVLKIGISNTKHFQHITNVPFLFKDRLAFGSVDKYASNFKVLGSMEFNVGKEMILIKVTLYLLMSVSLKNISFQKKVHLGIMY